VGFWIGYLGPKTGKPEVSSGLSQSVRVNAGPVLKYAKSAGSHFLSNSSFTTTDVVDSSDVVK
jgi:hypothetical protein